MLNITTIKKGRVQQILVLTCVYIYNLKWCYINSTLLGIISKLNIIHGANTIKAITIGNNIVQLNNIN